MPRKLYSFLVGVDKYPSPGTLAGCVNDVHKIKSYISRLETPFYDEIMEPTLLTDEAGNRENIIESLQALVRLLKEDDTLIFYFSGHGVNEISENLFYGNYNDLIQTLYCFPLDKNKDNKLANKELRYILNQCVKGAHILTLFDCCHSGDMTRSVVSNGKIKAASITPFPKREYEEFIFNKKTSPEQLRAKDFNDIFPDNNIVTLSACLSSERAWEYDGGGTFTNSLIKTLEASNSEISYSDLLKQIELHIRSTTVEKQTPTISILGDRKFDQLTSWLRLHGDKMKSGTSYIQYNEKSGWMFSKGKIHGVIEGDCISIKNAQNESIDLTIGQVNLFDSKLAEKNIGNVELERNNVYKVINEVIHKKKPVIGIHNLDENEAIFSIVKDILEQNESIIFSDNLEKCDYFINIFNDLLYFSFSDKAYQPLNFQFDLKLNKGQLHSLRSYFSNNLPTICNWFHFKNLEIQDAFKQIPVKIELKTEETDYCDVTQGNYSIKPKGRNNGALYSKYELKVTNESDDNIYLTLLAVYNSLHEIDAIENKTFEILPGKTKVYKNFIQFDVYQEVYNWEEEKVYLKFLVNNYGEITQEIASLTQGGFKAPMTHLGESRGGGSLKEIEDPMKNAMYTTELTLVNSTLNKVSGALESELQWYRDNDQLYPFIHKSYNI